MWVSSLNVFTDTEVNKYIQENLNLVIIYNTLVPLYVPCVSFPTKKLCGGPK